MLKKCEICGELYNAKTCSKTCGKFECKDKLYRERKERQYAKKGIGKPKGKPRKEPVYEQPQPKQNDTLCWSCQNYYNGCNWSRVPAKPVDGWTVEIKEIQHTANGRTTYDKSYKVISCPEYKKDKQRK